MAIAEDRGCSALAELICGYCSRDRERKYIVILQAFVDDSRSESGDKEFVLAGYMTTAEQWMQFSNEWAAVLAESPQLERGFHAIDAFHLRGQFANWKRAARDEKVERLIGVIERFPLASFDTRMSQESFRRILLPITPYDLKSPYMTLFFAVMVNAAQQVHGLGITVPIDFIFDEQGEVGQTATSWLGFMVTNLPPELRPLIGSSPIFRDDEKIMPLQAADLLAWALRKSREKKSSAGLDLANKLRRSGHTETWIPDEFLQSWADQFAMLPGVRELKKHSVKPYIAAIDERIKRLPKGEQGAAYRQFDDAMNMILRADPQEVKAAMERDKQLREEQRKAKKQPSASVPASSDKG